MASFCGRSFWACRLASSAMMKAGARSDTPNVRSIAQAPAVMSFGYLQGSCQFGPLQVTDPAADRPRTTQSAVDYFAQLGKFSIYDPFRQFRHTALSARGDQEVDMKRRF